MICYGFSGKLNQSQRGFIAFHGFAVYFCRIDILKYVIYGVAAAFFVYGILLMVEGFFTTGAIRDLYGDFKITTCGRCVSAWVRHITMVTMGGYQNTLTQYLSVLGLVSY